MKIKLIGLGQCGSFVVYDVIAFLFGQKQSNEIKAAPQSQWKRDVNKVLSRMSAGTAQLRMSLTRYFGGLKTPDIPKFYVIDGNLKNAVVDGLQGEEISKKLGPLQVVVQSLPLWKRNNGCNLGQVGEAVFQQEKELGKKSTVFSELRLNESVEINALVFAGGGGSGSGGAPVLNEVPRPKDSLLINMMILPPHQISDRRQLWNTGRCIMRLADIRKQTALLLFSNFSENLNDQFHVNQYISKLIIRLANFGYTGNVPRVATDIDRKDLQVFFSGKPAFVGMSSLDHDEPTEQDIATMVNQALSIRRNQNADGLSIEIPKSGERDLFSKVNMVMIAIGLTPKYKGDVDIVDIIKNEVAERLGTALDQLDCRAYSYTSPNDVELTIFLRHNDYRSNFLLNHFLDAYFAWHKNEQTEYEYLTHRVVVGREDGFLEDVLMALEQESDEKNPDWLRANLNSKIREVK
jgi:hypothetical protein